MWKTTPFYVATLWSYLHYIEFRHSRQRSISITVSTIDRWLKFGIRSPIIEISFLVVLWHESTSSFPWSLKRFAALNLRWDHSRQLSFVLSWSDRLLSQSGLKRRVTIAQVTRSHSPSNLAYVSRLSKVVVSARSERSQIDSRLFLESSSLQI